MNVLQLSRVAPHPPQNGAEVRVWKTAEKLAELGDLWLATPPNAEPLPAEMTHVELDTRLLDYRPLWNELWTGLFTITPRHPLRRLLTRAIVSTVNEYDASFDVVVCEFPQMADAAVRLAAAHDAWLLTNKHNADYQLLDGFLRERGVPDLVRRRGVGNFRSFEEWSVAQSDVVVFQSDDDADRFAEATPEETFVIPNGCDYESIRDGGGGERLRREWGLDPDADVCLFLGSYDYAPNRQAASFIDTELAPALDDVEFVLVGRDPPTPTATNVTAPGYVEDLPGALDAGDVALCPLFSGSGTKLKLLDYFAAGLPVVTTSVGVQGIPVADGEDALLAETAAEFVRGIERLVASPDLRASLADAGREIAAAHSWRTLMAKYDEIFRRLDSTPARTGAT